MKKIAICLLAALTVMLWSCDTKKQKEDAQVDTSAQRIDSLENALAQAQNETNDLMGTVEQIRDGFTAINEAEDVITTQSAKGESSDRQAILSNMALIQKKMNLNRELIKNLQEQLRTSKSSNAKMKSTLEQMNFVQNSMLRISRFKSRISKSARLTKTSAASRKTMRHRLIRLLNKTRWRTLSTTYLVRKRSSKLRRFCRTAMC